jgi:hypothetical protein
MDLLDSLDFYTLRRVFLRSNGNTDNADGANFHGFFPELALNFKKNPCESAPSAFQ